MKREAPFTEVSADELRDHAQPERVDRIWRRIEQDLVPRSRRRDVSRWIWAPAVAGGLFGAGVLVGAQWFAVEPPLSATVTAEPAPASEPASAPATASRIVIEPQPRPSVPRTRASRPVPSLPVVVEPQSSASVEPLVLLDPVVPAPVVVGPPEWQRFAEDGLYLEALAAVERSGGFDAVLGQATAEQLMLLVDVARFFGQRGNAIKALRRVLSQYGSDPNAPVAAWTLGNELSKAGEPDKAAQAFALYRALSPKTDLAEDALAREFEVAVERGNLEHARKLADQYAKDFPDGPRLEDIRAELESLHKRRAAGTDGNGGGSAQSGAPGQPSGGAASSAPK